MPAVDASRLASHSPFLTLINSGDDSQLSLKFCPPGFNDSVLFSRLQAGTCEAGEFTALKEGDSIVGIQVPNVDASGADDAAKAIVALGTRVATALWFELGGDDRLTLGTIKGCPTVNKYYSTTSPTPDVIHRGSCTSSSPSDGGFAAAGATLSQLWAGETFGDLVEEQRSRLLPALGIADTETTVIFHPSGSDAELIPTLLAALRSRALPGDGAFVHSIVTCAGEVGSGTADASRACHFSSVLPDASLGAKPKEPVLGFADLASITMTELVPRLSEAGSPVVPDYDDLVTADAEKFLDAHSNGVLVLHGVQGSKTGLCMPSLECIAKLQERFGQRILPVIDACQMRSSSQLLRDSLARNGIVLVTCSKFFGGPPFAGAVLIPNSAAAEMEVGLQKAGVPIGLGNYISSFEIPSSMATLKGGLPSWENIGLLLRWSAGLFEMERFRQLIETHGGDVVADRVATWCSRVREMLEDYVEVVGAGEVFARDENRIGRCNSIVPMQLRASQDSEFLGFDSMKLVHRLMWMDASGLMPEGSAASDVDAVRVRILLGQAVKYPPAAVLRTCVGAPSICGELFSDGGLDAMLKRDRLVLDKLAVVGRYFQHLSSRL